MVKGAPSLGVRVKTYSPDDNAMFKQNCYRLANIISPQSSALTPLLGLSPRERVDPRVPARRVAALGETRA